MLLLLQVPRGKFPTRLSDFILRSFLTKSSEIFR
jgi:hypothetical protein